jgi:hypothetical protein
MKKILLSTGAALFAIATVAQAQIDVVFKIDESGSMSQAIGNVRNNVQTIFDVLDKQAPGSRVGLVGYGSNHCGGNEQRAHIHTPLTSESDAFTQAISNMNAHYMGRYEQGYRAVYEAATDTIAFAWDGSVCTSNPKPSLGFTGAPYCSILITDETPNQNNQGGKLTTPDERNKAIQAMKDKNGVFFGIVPEYDYDRGDIDMFKELKPLADATGGKLFLLYNEEQKGKTNPSYDKDTFISNPQDVIEALLEACVWATSLKVSDGIEEGDCLPVSSTHITYTLDYENPSRNTIQEVEIEHTDGTWGASSWSENVGDLSPKVPGSVTATLPLGTLSPNMIFFNQFEMKSTSSGVAPAIAKKETQVCDDPLPVAQCKDVQALLNANGEVILSAADVDNGSYDPDPRDQITLSISKSKFTCSDIGSQSFITLTVTDERGQSASCLSKITVVDQTAPIVETKNITVQLDAHGKAAITASDVDDGSTDNCCIESRSISKSDFTCADVGPQEVTLTVTDCNGNSNSATATVTVQDTAAPVVKTKNITIELDTSGKAAITASDVDDGSTDNCCIESRSISKSDFTCADVGPQEVTLTVTDCNGNSNSATATVTVQKNLSRCRSDVPTEDKRSRR